jgi:enoyl-CoA hydratase
VTLASAGVILSPSDIAGAIGHSPAMIETSHAGPIATLTLARSGARNAIPMAGWQALADAARELAASSARVVILRSADKIFSAGADLAELPLLQADPAAQVQFRTLMRAGIDAIAALPMPTITAVDGGCFGAAVALALACDLRIVGKGGLFATTPAKLGLGYPQEDVARLRAQVGRGHAARMLFTGEEIDAAEALRIGLAEFKVPSAIAGAQVFARNVALCAPQAVRLLKRTLDSGQDPALDAAFEDSFGGPEFALGLAAFQGRRLPEYP